MRLFVFMLMLLTFASESFAETWKYITESDAKYPLVLELNAASVEEVGNNVRRAQYRLNYKNFPHGLDDKRQKDLRITADFDCKRLRMKIVRLSGADAWGRINPDSAYEQPEMPVFREIEGETSLNRVVRDEVCAMPQ